MLALLYAADSVGPVCKRLSDAAVKNGLDKFLVIGDHQTVPAGVTTVVRWGSRRMVVPNGLIINSAEAINNARDKRKSRQLLGDLAPKTWYVKEHVKFPCVVRPRRHHAGLKFFVCHNMVQLSKAVKLCKLGWYASELVNKAREYRVFVLHGRVVGMSQRFPANAQAVAWNLAQGGKLINVKFKSWPLAVCAAAIEATKRVGLDWSAMDLAVDQAGKAVVFEANTAPGLRNPYTLSSISKAFSWADKHSTLPKPGNGTKWQGYVHPSLKESDNA